MLFWNNLERFCAPKLPLQALWRELNGAARGQAIDLDLHGNWSRSTSGWKDFDETTCGQAMDLDLHSD